MTQTADVPQVNQDLDVEALRRHITSETNLAPGPLSATLIAGGRSNPTYMVTDGNYEWVLRRPPFGVVLATAHDMSREYRVLSALNNSAVPVPKTVLMCDDPSILGAPFYLMDRLDGRTIRDRTAAEALTPEDRAKLADAMIDVLVNLHEIDTAEVGLSDWGRPDGYLTRQLKRWRKQWDAAHARDFAVIDELFEVLTQKMPETLYPGIVHGDYKVDNVMITHDDPGRIIGLLDWEMSTLGDTLADVGLLISFWDEPGRPFNPLTNGVTALDGFPSCAEMIQKYADRRGIDLSSIDWYLAFADTKIAIILEGIYVRHLAGKTVGDGFDGLDAMIEPLLLRALETLKKHS